MNPKDPLLPPGSGNPARRPHTWSEFAIGLILAAAGAFVLFKALDVIMMLSVYSWFFKLLKLEGTLPDGIAGAISVLLTAAAILTVPTLITSYIFRRKRRRKVIVQIAVALSVGMMVMYGLAQPRNGALFNHYTGKPWYKYSEDGGQFTRFPLGYSHHPCRGKPLPLLTADVAEKLNGIPPPAFERCGLPALAKPQPAGISGSIPVSEPEPQVAHNEFVDAYRNVKIRIDRVVVTPNRTRVFLSARNLNDEVEGYIHRYGGYLSDNDGYPYELKIDHTPYTEGWSGRTVRPKEVLRFEIDFQPLRPEAKQFSFFHTRFKKGNLEYPLKGGERTDTDFQVASEKPEPSPQPVRSAENVQLVGPPTGDYFWADNQKIPRLRTIALKDPQSILVARMNSRIQFDSVLIGTTRTRFSLEVRPYDSATPLRFLNLSEQTKLSLSDDDDVNCYPGFEEKEFDVRVTLVSTLLDCPAIPADTTSLTLKHPFFTARLTLPRS